MSLADRIEKLAGEATPGPWVNHGRPSCTCPIVIGQPKVGRNYTVLKAYRGMGNEINRPFANADLVVELVNNLPTILAALRAQEKNDGE